jgi:Domain of unknown function (DUF222)/HNH endonuclease
MSITGLVSTAAQALTALSAAAGEVCELDDAAFLSLASSSAVIRKLSDAHAAVIAGETARRSARELGQSGLAQRLGFRTPQELVRVTTGSTAGEANAAVRVGSLPPSSPIATAVGETLSIAAADAISRGLGEPTEHISEAQLSQAAAALISEFGGLDADSLYRHARQLRDELDAAGVADREAQLFAKRSLRVFKQPDGTTRLSWLMDPETAAIVTDLFDRATSPKLGGPRFVSGSAAEQAARIADDPRTVDQLASDVFVDLLRAGADADSSQILGSGAPVVRYIVTRKDLDAGAAADSTELAGVGYIEGQTAPVSIGTIERAICSGGTQEALFDANLQPLDISAEQRLFSRKQKTVLALSCGGCMIDGCGAPPSWTEAHHLKHWSKNGKTTIENGVLLCRFHHLWLHNNGWEIIHHDNEYWLVPPPNVDAKQTPRLLRSKSQVLRRPA